MCKTTAFQIVFVNCIVNLPFFSSGGKLVRVEDVAGSEIWNKLQEQN